MRATTLHRQSHQRVANVGPLAFFLLWKVMRTNTVNIFTIVALALIVSACGDSPTSPSTSPSPTPPPSTTPPAATTVSLSGTVSAQAGGRVVGATVTFLDGANSGRSTTTNGNGEYRFDAITQGNANLGAVAPGYEEARGGVFANNNGLNFMLRSAAPWRQDGNGNTVFDRATYFNRVRIIGIYNGNSSNFIIKCGSQLVVNELVGTSWRMVRYEGVHLLTASCNPIQITNSSGVAWNIIEER